MATEPVEATSVPAAPVLVEPVRVLVPSQIGVLAVEFYGLAIGRLIVAPSAKLKKLFHPLAAYDDSDFLDEVFGRISEFLSGARRTLELETDLAPCGIDSFARRVLRETTRIPYGRTKTYKEIAEAAGRPDAYRQVLSILLANPLPLLVPCHRVIPTREGIGKWVGGSSRKRWLLKLERETVAAQPS